MRWGWVTLGSLMLVTGCETDPSKGWVLGTTYSTDIKTIAIPVVQNDTFDRESATC